MGLVTHKTNREETERTDGNRYDEFMPDSPVDLNDFAVTSPMLPSNLR